MKRKILFVDDEQNVLTGLKRMLRVMRDEWDMEFIESGEQALEFLSREYTDVVISDIRMPGMDGLKLLAEIKQKYPHILRIVLSGESNAELLYKSTSVSHQFLSKPCNAEMLKSVIAHAYALNNLFNNESLKKRMAQIDSLPSIPSLYAEIMEVLNSPSSSLKKVGEIISKDIGMSAKILQLVNSAYFGLSREISNPSQAVTLLGMNTIKSLVLSIHIFSQVDIQKISAVSIDELWNHNMKTGVLAKAISRAETNDSILIDNAFLAGLLHDSGKLILMLNFSDEYRQVMNLSAAETISMVESEQQVFGTTHAEAGAYLLGRWGLPSPVVEAIAYHHTPGSCQFDSTDGFSALTAVHVANALAHHLPCPNDHIINLIDDEYLKRIGKTERLQEWLKITSEIITKK